MCKSFTRLPKVLLVDDEINTITLFQQLLPQERFHLLTAATGKESIEVMHAAASEGYPVNLILYDYYLPDTTGLDLLHTIRSDTEIAKTKVLFLSSLDQYELRIEALRNGADDFLSKACQGDELLIRIEHILQRDLNERLIADMNRRSAVLHEINRRISEDIVSNNDRMARLNFILEKLSQFVEYDSASIILIKNQQLEIVAEHGFRSAKQHFTPEQLSQLSHVKQVIDTSQPQIIPDTSNDPRWYLLPDEEYIACWMGIPLIYKNEVIGVLNMDKIVKGFYTQQHISDSLAFASYAAIAINNARAFEEYRRNSLLAQNLVKISNLLAEKKDMSNQLTGVWTFVRENLKANMFYVALFHEFPRCLTFEILYDLDQPVPLNKAQPIMLSNIPVGIIDYVFLRNTPLCWMTAAEKKKVLRVAGIRARKLGHPSESAIVLPLEAGEQMIGVISIQNHLPNAWTDLEQNAFYTLASQVAVNIQNTRLFEDVQKNSDNLMNAYEAGELITTAVDPAQVLKQIIDNTYRMLGAGWACINLMDAEGNPQHVEVGNFPRTPQRETWARKGGVSEQVFNDQKAVFIENVADYNANPHMLKDGVQAAACLPFTSNERALGVLWVHYPAPRHFSPGDQAAWKLYAKQAAIAYENATRIIDLERIRATSEGLAKSDTVCSVSENLVTSACPLFGSDSAVFLPYNQDHSAFSFRCAVQSGVPEDTWHALRSNNQAFLPIDLFSQSDYCIFPDVVNKLPVEENYKAVSDFIRSMKVRTSIAKELQINGEKLGALFINYDHPYSPPASDRDKAFTLAYQASLSMKKAMLLEQLQRVNNTARAAALWTVRGDLRGTLDSIAEGSLTTFKCDVVTLYSYNQGKQYFDFPPAMAGENDPDKITELNRVERNSMPYRILAVDQPLVVPDTCLPGAMVGKFTLREGVRSWVGIPLIVSKQKVGVMFINFRQKHFFSPNELANIQLFSNLAAIAISYAQQVVQIEQAQKAAASNMMVDFMTNMKNSHLHQLKGFATRISDQLFLLKEDIEARLSPTELFDRLKKIQEVNTEINAMPYWPMQSEVKPESIPINSLINERLTQFRRKTGKYEGKKFIVDFKISDQYRVSGYIELLRRALDILINNSVDALDRVSDNRARNITFETRLSPDQQYVEIRVEDNGTGIPAELQQTIIQKPIQKTAGEKGSGMGLYITGSIVSMHYGTIEIERSNEHGTVFVIRLPLERRKEDK